VSAALAVSAFLRAGSCSWCSFSAISASVRALASALPYVFQCTHPLGLAYLDVPARFHFRPVSACPRPGGAVDAGICQARSCSREEGVLVLLGEIRPRYAELWVAALTFGCAKIRAISCRIVPPSPPARPGASTKRDCLQMEVCPAHPFSKELVRRFWSTTGVAKQPWNAEWLQVI
jgi:hypothetical protein